MLKKIIYRLLERRHFWRYASFDEIAELYASRMLRTMAVSMVSVFIAIYLYQNGYHLTFIMLYFSAYFVLRAALSFPSAFVVARIGPKHANLISNFLYVPALLGLTQLDTGGIWVLVASGIFQAASVSLYDVSHLVNFSKVKHADRVGKELSFMYIVERVGHSLSPLIGGFVAFGFGPRATLILAACIFIVAALPLFFTAEPVKTKQIITFRNYNLRDTWRGIVANAAIGADFIVSGSVWSLYVAIAIFGTTSNAVYAQIGALMSVTIIAALAFSRLYGAIIDRKRGGDLLKWSVLGNSLMHITRIFISTPAGVVLINTTNEAATTGYAMPFAKGMFDQADRLPGYRIVYMSLMSTVIALGAAAMGLAVGIISMFFTEVQSMQISFLLAAFIVLVIRIHRFPALGK